MRNVKESKAQKVYEIQKQRLKNLGEESFFVAGLMLYLAEGAKKKESSIVLANTDPRVIKFFIKWMQEFLHIPKDKMRVQLHLYENMNIEKEVSFWIESLSLERSQVYKPSIRILRKSSFSYKESYRHGTCSLYAFGVDKCTELLMAIKALLDVYNIR